MSIDITRYMPADGAAACAAAVTPVLNSLQPSAILALAAQVRRLKADGRAICDLTVGDFSSKHFPIPDALRQALVEALAAGHTNYPPSDGVPELKAAVARLFSRDMGIDYPSGAVVIASGARPLLYGTWRLFVDPGERSVSFVPSWNNGYYAHLTQADHTYVRTEASENFFPTVEQVRAVLPGTRLLMLNSPLNPTGTAIDAERLAGIATAVVEENARRRGGRPVMLCYDQVYWMLTFGGVRHVNPVALVPEVAPYTVQIDALSKGFAATGLRVGWGLMPPHLVGRMSGFLGHVGAWAPRAEQVATAWLLDRPDVMVDYHRTMLAEIDARLNRLYSGVQAMRARGLPLDAIRPQGGIYLSLHVDLVGRGFDTNHQIASFLIDKAGVAVVPFQAFDLMEDTGWFRMSVGAVGLDELDGALERLEAAVGAHLAAR